MTALVDPTRPGTNGDLGHNVCTAVLIAPQRVLTAAHCVVGDDHATPKPANRFQVLVGRRDLTITTQGERRNVTGVVVHPKAYLPQTRVHTYHAFYDIAVLFLDTPITTVPPAIIGATDDWNTWATAMGFGHFNYYNYTNQQFDQYLRAADYDLLSDAQCAAFFDDADTRHFYGTIHVCANNAPNAATVDCITHGDSGGPLMIRKADLTWRLIGTAFSPNRVSTAFGIPKPRCARPYALASSIRSLWSIRTTPENPVSDASASSSPPRSDMRQTLARACIRPPSARAHPDALSPFWSHSRALAQASITE